MAPAHLACDGLHSSAPPPPIKATDDLPRDNWSRFCVSIWDRLACGGYSARQGCPCGYFTDPARECRCTPYQIQRYISKISGPLLDRIDIHVEVPRVKHRELEQGQSGATIAAPRQSSRPSRESSSCQAKR